MQKFIYLPLLLIALTLSGCAVYKPVIQQGNIVTQSMVDQLRPGMTKQQVQYIMGTPVINNTFNSDRWDYAYSWSKGGDHYRDSRLSLFFKNDKLTHITGNYMPHATPNSTTN